MLYRFTLSILMAFAAQAKANIVTTEFNVSQVPTDVTVNTTFPPFANLGGPVRHESPAHPPPTTRSPTHPHARSQADLTGSLYQQESGYIGMITPSGFTSSLYLGEYRIAPHATDSLSLSFSLFLTRTSLVRQVMVNTCCRWDDSFPGSALAYPESIVPPSCAY